MNPPDKALILNVGEKFQIQALDRTLSGLPLKRACHFPLSIHCIGAAIGFLTGNQVCIPVWADRLFLGWLFRCLSEPRRYVPRYWKAVRLVPMLIQYREKPPVLLTVADEK